MKTLTEVIITVGRIEQAELVRWVELGSLAKRDRGISKSVT